MNSDSPDLKTAMLKRIHADAPRKVWTPSDFVDLASRDAVDKTLQRLTKAGHCREEHHADEQAAAAFLQRPPHFEPRARSARYLK